MIDNGRNGYVRNQSSKSMTKQNFHNNYVTNFPSHFIKRGLWKMCQNMELFLIFFITTRLSKIGKHFSFTNVDYLVSNFRTLCIGKMKRLLILRGFRGVTKRRIRIEMEGMWSKM